MVTLTVTVSQQLLKPGVSLSQMFPGDPSMVELLKAAGADVPALGDSGNKATDPYETEARRGALTPDDPLTAQFRSYQARQQMMNGAHAPTPYDKIPESEIYSTVIVARASLEGAVIATEKGRNASYYGRPVSARAILTGKVPPPPGSAALRRATGP